MQNHIKNLITDFFELTDELFDLRLERADCNSLLPKLNFFSPLLLLDPHVSLPSSPLATDGLPKETVDGFIKIFVSVFETIRTGSFLLIAEAGLCFKISKLVASLFLLSLKPISDAETSEFFFVFSLVVLFLCKFDFNLLNKDELLFDDMFETDLDLIFGFESRFTLTLVLVFVSGFSM